MIGFDLRGHGFSSGKRGHASPRSLLFSDIENILDILKQKYPDCPLYLYGHSMGGNIVLDFMKNGKSRNGITGCIVTAPWLVLVRKISAPVVFLFRIIAAVKPDFTINTGLQAKDISKVDDEVNKYMHDPLIHHFISAGTAIDGINASQALLSAEHGSGKAMLLMHGSQDRICSIEGSRKLSGIENPSCDYVEWDGLYHEIHNEKNGAQVLDTIVGWIKKTY